MVAALLIAVPSAVGAAGPTVSASPTIAGSPTQGNRLTAAPGVWHGAGKIRFAYRWYRCDTMGGRCAALRGVRRSHYTLVAGDVGHTLAVDVRATDSAGSTNGYSSLIGPVAGSRSTPAAVVQPTISGTASLGGSVRVDMGTWKPTPESFAYQWIRCNANGRGCASIIGESSASHTVVRRDVAHALVAIVQARSGTTSRAVLSRATPRIEGTAPPPAGAPPPPAAGPVPTAAPTVAAVARQGKQLTGVAGTWSGAGTIQYAYQWYRCDQAGAHCQSIHGSTKPTYTQVTKDVGHTLGFTVHATDSNGTNSAYASLIGPTAAKSSPLYSTTQPTISGTATPGQTLQAATGNWSKPPTSYSYHWQRCNPNGRLCTPIPTATQATYTVTTSDSNHTLLATIQAVSGGLTQPIISVGAVAP
jgi:hypothetical protein